MKSIADYFHLPDKMPDSSIIATVKVEDKTKRESKNFLKTKPIRIKLNNSKTSEISVLSSDLEDSSKEIQEKISLKNGGKDEKENANGADKTSLGGERESVSHEVNSKKVDRRKRPAVTENPESSKMKRPKKSYEIVDSDTDDDTGDYYGNKRKGGTTSKKVLKKEKISNKRLSQKTNCESSVRAVKTDRKQRRRKQLKSNNSIQDNCSVEQTERNLEENNCSSTQEPARRKNCLGKLNIIITKSGVCSNSTQSPARSETDCNGKSNGDVTMDFENITECEQISDNSRNLQESISPEGDTKKKNSLFSYFGKVSKEQFQQKPDRIEVKALIHTPLLPSEHTRTHFRATTKKSKKGKRLLQLESMDKIEVLGSEDLPANLEEAADTAHTNPTETVGNNVKSCFSPLSKLSNDTLKNKTSSPGWKMRIRLKDGSSDDYEDKQCTDASNTEHLPPKHHNEGKETILQKNSCETRANKSKNRLCLFLDSKNTKKIIEKSHLDGSSDVDISIQIKEDENNLDVEASNILKKPKEQDCVKLAPVFIKQRTRKLRPDADTIIARKSFLESGVPETLKKTVELKRLAEEQEQDVPIFPSISHVQQRDSSCIWDLPCVSLPLGNTVEEFNVTECCKRWPFKELINLNKENLSTVCKEKFTFPADILFRIVSEIKSSNPELPVNRLFKNLCNKFLSGKIENDKKLNTQLRKKSKRLRSSKSKLHTLDQIEKNCDVEPTVMWCEKYKPLNSREVLGTKGAAVRLKKWLESWKQRSKDSRKQHKKTKNVSSSSDEDFRYSESSDSYDLNNAAVLLGPYGCGKTSSVYAVAGELGFEVLEINASIKRTGKKMLADLQEATQSHRIGVSGAEPNQLAISKLFKKGKKNEKSHKKEEVSKKKMTLILVEEVDVVFDDHDEGFVSALSTLVATSKRPVIFTATDENCIQVARLLEKHLVLRYDIVPSRLLNTWLQLICLLEGVRVSNDAIKNALEYTHYDIRKTMTLLQFWVLSGGNNIPFKYTGKGDSLLPFVDFENADNSNLSWSSVNDDVALPVENVDSIGLFVNCNHSKVQTLSIPFPVDLCGVWWNLAPLLNLAQIKLCGFEKVSVSQNEHVKNRDNDTFLYYDSDSAASEDDGKNWLSKADSIESEKWTSNNKRVNLQHEKSLKPGKCSSKMINAMTDLMDNLCCIDVMDYTVAKCRGSSGNKEMKIHCWDQMPKDSTSLIEDETCFVAPEIQSLAHWLTEESIKSCKQDLKILDPINYSHVLPSHKTSRLLSEHHFVNGAVWDIVPQSSWLSRYAMSTDYSPFMRSMSRLQDTSLKAEKLSTTRCRQRYFHYLKDIGTTADIGTCKALSSIFKGE